MLHWLRFSSRRLYRRFLIANLLKQMMLETDECIQSGA
ncbi:MAG: hypothetical protein KatS3mg049_3339 [Caldilinea sp.]|nr:MAG: hypothetical protein KatS3mg049_3339 [Caldilinea sp.]